MKKNIIAIFALIALVGWGLYDSKSKPELMPQEELSEVKVGNQIGNMAPDFELTSLEGEPVKLSDYRGKKVLLNFWATWCPPCRAEMPHMEAFYKDYKDKDVVILGVNLTHTAKFASDVPEFVEEFGLTFPILLDNKGKVSDEFYQVIAYPTTFVIDSKGIISERFRGAINYEIMEKSTSKLR